MSPISHDTYAFVRSFQISSFILWGTLWGLVAWHYGRAAFTSWQCAGGRWRDAIWDLVDPFWWAIREQMCRWNMFKGATFCGHEIPTKYERGHLLRFSIFLGSLSPVVWGLGFALQDRTGETLLELIVKLIFVASSCLAAGGHLFLAYRGTPHGWRRLVVWSTAWILISPIVFGILRA